MSLWTCEHHGVTGPEACCQDASRATIVSPPASALPGKPEGATWTEQDEQAMQYYAALRGHGSKGDAHDFIPKFAREILRLRAENEKHRAYTALIEVEASARDGGWNESGLLAVGNDLIDRADEIERLRSLLSSPSAPDTRTDVPALQRELQAWRWLHWGNEAASWACSCGNANGAGLDVCDDCLTPRPAKGVALSVGLVGVMDDHEPRSPSGTGSAMPMQPTFIDQHGARRFRANAIVRHLLDAGPFDMNALASVPGNSEVYAGGFPREDWEQFAQLIGYSLGGFSELSYVSDAAYERAEVRSPEVEEAGEADTLIDDLLEASREYDRGGPVHPFALAYGIIRARLRTASRFSGREDKNADA